MKEVYELIKQHDTIKYRKLMDYYLGKSPITLRYREDHKPNNKIVSSFAINAVDTVVGYFMGKPVSYTAEDFDKYQEILSMNDEQEVNAEHAKQVAVKGKSYEMLWTDEESNLRFAQLNPENVIIEYDDSLIPRIKRAVVYYYDSDDKGNRCCHYTVYEPGTFIEKEYKQEGSNDPVLVDERPLIFSEIPIVEYSANSDCTGLFEKATSIIDAYEQSVSDTANDLEYFTDAYLWLPGFGGYDPESEDDVNKLADMRNNKVFLPTDTQNNNDKPDFIVKQINDTATENHKDRLKDEIHKMLNIPDLSDENFAGTQSGVSMKFKLWGLENICSTFERRFKKSLQKRLRLIDEYLTMKGNTTDSADIQISFSRNLPDNTVEMAELVEKLRSLISDRTLLSWIDRVDDPERELERRQDEMDSMIDLDNFGEEEGE